MKNKLTVNTLAMGNLKQRKKQYTIMIIGIILAMIFTSGVPFFIMVIPKLHNDILILLPLDPITHAVIRTGYHQKILGAVAGFIGFVSHFHGNESIFGSMNEQHRYITVQHSVHR